MRRDEFPIVHEYAKDQVNKVLNEIKADIIDLAEGWNGMQAKNVPLGAVLKVIDKYKAESEDKE